MNTQRSRSRADSIKGGASGAARRRRRVLLVVVVGLVAVGAFWLVSSLGGPRPDSESRLEVLSDQLRAAGQRLLLEEPGFAVSTGRRLVGEAPDLKEEPRFVLDAKAIDAKNIRSLVIDDQRHLAAVEESRPVVADVEPVVVVDKPPRDVLDVVVEREVITGAVPSWIPPDPGVALDSSAGAGVAMGLAAADFMLYVVSEQVVAGVGDRPGMTGLPLGDQAPLFGLPYRGPGGRLARSPGETINWFGVTGTATAEFGVDPALGMGWTPAKVSARPVVVSPLVGPVDTFTDDENARQAAGFLSTRSGQVRRIYQQYLSENPGLEGRLVFEIVVDNGVVEAVVTDNTTGNAALAEEVAAVLNGMSIVGVEGTVMFRLPFNLYPQL